MNIRRLTFRMPDSRIARRRANKGMLTLPLAILLTLLLSACNGNPQLQQHANQNKSDLDRAVAHAQSIGVPDFMLQPIIGQENQLSNTNTPFGLLNDQGVNDYYTNVTQRYAMLTVEVNGLISQSTQQLDYKASLDLQGLENALAQRQAQNCVEAKAKARRIDRSDTASGRRL